MFVSVLSACGDKLKDAAGGYAKSINSKLDKINSPQYKDRLVFKSKDDQNVVYTCGDSTLSFVFESELLKEMIVKNDDWSFLTVAIGNIKEVNIPSTSLNEEQSLIYLGIKDGTFEKGNCTVTRKGSTITFTF